MLIITDPAPLTPVVMRVRRTALVLVLVVLALFASVALAGRRPSAKPAIAINVLGYTNWRDYLCARIRLTNKGNSSVSYDSQATGPSGWMRIQSTNGWADEALSAMAGAPMLLRPGSSIVFSAVMPTNTLRWQFGFVARTASLRERVFWRVPGGWWNRVYLLREWPRLFPHKTGLEQEVKSDIFEPHLTRTSTNDAHNTY